MGDLRFRNISYIVISIFERARPAPAPARPARGQRAWDLGVNVISSRRASPSTQTVDQLAVLHAHKYIYMYAERALLPLPFFFGDLSGARPRH